MASRRVSTLHKDYTEPSDIESDLENSNDQSADSLTTFAVAKLPRQWLGSQTDIINGTRTIEREEDREWTHKSRRKAKTRKVGAVSARRLAKTPRGALAFLLALPLDVLCSILSTLDPYSLYCVSISSKQLHLFLWSKKSKSIWSASRRTLDFHAVLPKETGFLNLCLEAPPPTAGELMRIPPPPPYLIDPVYARDFFNLKCQTCGVGGAGVWRLCSVHISTCYGCLSKVTTRNFPYFDDLDDQANEALQEMTLSGGLWSSAHEQTWSLLDLEKQLGLVRSIQDEFGHNQEDYELELGLARDERCIVIKSLQQHGIAFRRWLQYREEHQNQWRELAEHDRIQQLLRMLEDRTHYSAYTRMNVFHSALRYRKDSPVSWIYGQLEISIEECWNKFLRQTAPLLEALEDYNHIHSICLEHSDKWQALTAVIEDLLPKLSIPNAKLLFCVDQAYHWPFVQNLILADTVAADDFDEEEMSTFSEQLRSGIETHISSVLSDLNALLPGRNPDIRLLETYKIKFVCSECDQHRLQFPELLISNHVNYLNVRNGREYVGDKCEHSTALRPWDISILTLDVEHYKRANRLLAALDKNDAKELDENRELMEHAAFICLDCPQEPFNPLDVKAAEIHVTHRTMVRQYDKETKKCIARNAVIHDRLELIRGSTIGHAIERKRIFE